MFASRSEAIYELLRDEVRVDPGRLADLMLESRTTGQPLADAAIEHGLVEKPVLLARIAGHLGCPFIADPPGELATEIVKLLPAALVPEFRVPVVARLAGNGLAAAREIFLTAGIALHTDLDEAVAEVKRRLEAA